MDDARSRRPHRHASDADGHRPPDVVAGGGGGGRREPALAPGTDALPVPARDSDDGGGGAHHVRRPPALSVVRARAALHGDAGARRLATRRADYVGARGPVLLGGDERRLLPLGRAREPLRRSVPDPGRRLAQPRGVLRGPRLPPGAPDGIFARRLRSSAKGEPACPASPPRRGAASTAWSRRRPGSLTSTAWRGS